MKLSVLHIFIIGMLVTKQSAAQSFTSPYSIYGIGDINNNIYNHNSGKAYTGLALKTTLFGSGNNPASLAGLDRSYFIFNLSGTGKIITYAGDKITVDNNKVKDFIVTNMSLGTKLNNVWASGIGFNQYSSVNYSFNSVKSVEGDDATYPLYYAGSGGINRYYWNNAFALNKHLSIGVTSSFLAGPINQTESIIDEASAVYIVSKRRDYYSGFKQDYGLIYNAVLNKNWQIALGATFSNRTKLTAERTLNVTDSSSSSAIINESFIKNVYFNLPQSYGVGIALSNSKGATFTADYTFENWSALKIKGTGWSALNTNRVSIGAEFARFIKSFNEGIQKKAFQFGAYAGNTYQYVKNQQLNEWGVTAGYIRSLSNGLMYSISAAGGVRGTATVGLIKENFYQLTLSLSYRNLLYSRLKKYK